MMKPKVLNSKTGFFRRGESGQSIVILAIGFVALLAFVGIVTDVSLMYVRYTQLKRAIDSASIAAAGQMRQDRSLATVGLAARQFIEFHGLNPQQVVVETCATVPDRNNDGRRDSADDPEICTGDQRKLVRVTAQVLSPTVFLRLIGWPDITLEASAVSETAVLDVVVIMDVSESMLRETSYEDWAKVGLGVVYQPPKIETQPNSSPGVIYNDKGSNGYTVFVNYWQNDLLGVSQEIVNRRLKYTAPTPADPNGTPRDAYLVRSFHNAIPGYGSQQDPRVECRVRFHPGSIALSVPSDDPNDLLSLYGTLGAPWGGTTWKGFVPTYNFYGCCNDPAYGITVDENGNYDLSGFAGTGADGDFSDLVCQPFKKARDATRQFLQRIDFLRGDRVAFVTFDRSAFLIDPDGAGERTHMIDNYEDAKNTLNKYIGVRAEPNFYLWNSVSGGWNDGTKTVYTAGFNEDGSQKIIDYGDPLATSLNDYPVKDNCPFQNAYLQWPFSRYGTTGKAEETDSVLYRIMIPNATNPLWSSFGLIPANSYEMWASCRNGNVGAALREANNALLDPDTIRRTGTIWVMVLLSDGAAGGSDPVRRNREKIQLADPYKPVGGGVYGQAGQYGGFGLCPIGRPDRPAELTDTANEPDSVVFPYCLDEDPESRHFCSFRPAMERDYPSGSGGYDARLDNDGINALLADPSITFDEQIRLGNVYDVDIDGSDDPNVASLGGCDADYYDVDDYARDWADFIGLASATAGEDAQLPTIFTIGFGINFSLGDGSCEANIADCLGEEYLRYVADVGDNFRVDTDFQQDWLDDKQLNLSVSPEDWGPRGPCEGDAPGAKDADGQYTSIDAMINRLPPKQNCGNYFNAPDQAELERVFDEIASRMFTRLAG